MLVFEERGKLEYPEKNLSEQGRENKLNPHMVSTPGFEPGPHWWEASALTTAPPLLPLLQLQKTERNMVEFGTGRIQVLGDVFAAVAVVFA